MDGGRSVRRIGWIALLVVWVVWGSTYFAIRVGVETLPPLLMAGVRYLVAGLGLFPVALRGGPPSLRASDRPRLAAWGAAAAVGTLLLAGGNGGVTVGERSVPSGLASLLVATVPLWLIVIDRVVNQAPILPVALVGLLAGVGSLVGVWLRGHGAGGIGGVGDVIILVAAVSWASGTILSRRLPLPSRPLLATAMEMITGGVVLLVAAVAAGEIGQFHPGLVSLRSLLALLYLIGPGSIVALTAYVVAVRNLPTATVATYAYVNPIIAVLLGTTLLGESVTTSMLVGGGLVIVAVALVLRSQTGSVH